MNGAIFVGYFAIFIFFQISSGNNGQCRLKLIESQELPTKKVTENPILTNCFIVFYCSDED